MTQAPSSQAEDYFASSQFTQGRIFRAAAVQKIEAAVL
jgi:hypothetical protein